MQDRIKSRRERRRGRPRAFDEATVLDRAAMLFWSRGYAAVSLDDLATAMQMNRPSIANAFGDKKALYRAALARFAGQVKAEVAAVLEAPGDLASALTSFYYAALDVYCRATPALGCFVMCTAPTEAAADPDVRADLRTLIDEIDGVLGERFTHAKRDGDLPRDADVRAAARMAQAVLHSLAIRARSGASKASLREMARAAARTLAS